MAAQYLIRMDDACHTMDRHKWQMLEEIFHPLGIKPLVAVVPENDDPDLRCAEPDPAFWSTVRRWQAKGWTIAMHGYSHVMHESKRKPILPFYNRTEFVGLDYESQIARIRLSWRVFASQQVEPKVWIAPAHSFDRWTLEAIKAETPIRIVSDGIACDQHFDGEFYWIPQQLWSFRERRGGLWTVCLHPNTMTIEQIEELRKNIEGRFAKRIIALDTVVLRQRKKSPGDRITDICFWQRHRMQRLIRQIVAIARG
jgi:predicted deacetylase